MVEVQITSLAAGGDGVGRTDAGCVVFVADSVPGDRLEVRLTRVKKDHAFGKTHRLIEPSAQRTRARCIVADRCGSCQWQWVDYAVQLDAKQDLVRAALERLGGFRQPPVLKTLRQEPAFGYRNKSTFPVGRNSRGEVIAGYYRKDSHRIVNINACPVQDRRLDPLLVAAKQAISTQGWSVYDEVTHTGTVRHLAMRIGERTGEILLTLVVTTWDLPGVTTVAEALQVQFPELVGVCLNLNSEPGNTILGSQTRCVAGRPYLNEVLDGFTFRIEPTTFFQIHTVQAEVLARLVVEAAQAGAADTVIDCYCGTGALSLPLARGAGRVVGIESHTRSVEQAHANALANGLTNCAFLTGTVEEQLGTLTPDIVVLDPPRRGCEESVLRTIVDQAPRRVVYVSCNPATLARDLKVLCAERYLLESVQPIDLFAQTYHVEAVAALRCLA